MRALVLALLVAGCSRPARGPASPPADALGCKADAATRDACVARGSAYRLTPDPLYGCSGTELPPEESRAIADARPDQPCKCMTQDEIERGARACREMP